MNGIFDTYASKEAITYMKDDGTKAYFSFSDIFSMVKHWGKCFEKCGLQSGDRVAIVAPHAPKSLIASMALIYANIITVMLDPALPKEEIQRLLEFSDVQGVFTVDKIYSHFKNCLINSVPVFDIEHS